MYKIDGEDLYLIGTSEHSMIGKFKDQFLQKADLPYTMTSYSPCFRKEKGAHGIEERGVYRIHQFEKQEMIVICEPEDSKQWYDKMWSYTVELFRNMEIPVRTLECCSGDLADLKAKVSMSKHGAHGRRNISKSAVARTLRTHRAGDLASGSKAKREIILHIH